MTCLALILLLPLAAAVSDSGEKTTGSKDSASKFDSFFAVCGLLGAIVFPCSLLPQIYKTFTSKSAEDISYFWQGCFMVGLVGLAIYTGKYQLWPILYPMVVEGCLMILLIGLKIRYDNSKSKQEETSVDEPGETHSPPATVMLSQLSEVE